MRLLILNSIKMILSDMWRYSLIPGKFVDPLCQQTIIQLDSSKHTDDADSVSNPKAEARSSSARFWQQGSDGQGFPILSC